MKKAKNTRLHVWELALLLALAAAILWGAASLSRQEDLGRKVIRLHVIANSDSPEDQALKLRVRDRVLARAQELLEQSADMAQAREVLTSALPELTREAQQVLAAAGCGDGVRARLEPTEFPTKDYDGFSLPAGKYLALRVIIGEGRGQNWWCGVSAAVHRRRLRLAGRRTGRRDGRGRPVPDGGGGPGLSAPVPVRGAVGKAAPMAGKISGILNKARRQKPAGLVRLSKKAMLF